MKSISSRAIKTTYGIAVAILVVSALAPALLTSRVGAQQLTSRYIKMEQSAPSAAAIEYEIGFTTSATSVRSVVIEFCSDSPLIGDTCTATAGTDVPDLTSVAVAGTGTGTIGAWSDITSSTTTALHINSNAGTANTTPGAHTIIATGIDNPSDTGAFFARITTYSDDGYGTYASAAAPGNYVDDGGVALSTATQINITARVMETLTFCTSKALPGAGCTATDAPNLVLGHGPRNALDNTAVDTDTAHFQVSTNASGDVIVRMKGDVLDNGTDTIPATPAGANTPFAIAAGTADFGMRVGTTSGTDYSASDITIDSNYLHATNYGYDVTTGGDNTSTTYGDTIATVAASQNTFALMNFAATAALTTPAGLYQSTQELIATGTY